MTHFDMTRYLLPNEKILYQGKRHWMIFSAAILWYVATVLFLVKFPELKKLIFFPLLIGLVETISSSIEFFYSELIVTNQRVWINLGLIRRRAVKVFLSEVTAVDINQSAAGRIFSYGTMGIAVNQKKTGIPILYVNDPLLFRKAVLDAQTAF